MRNFHILILLTTSLCHHLFVSSLPSSSPDVDCGKCSSEECTLDITIPCCKFCLAHIKCTTKEMVVKIPLAAINGSNLQSLSLADISCRGVVQGKFIIFKTGMSECKTKSIFLRNTHIMYKNEIRNSNGKPIYSLTCLFKRDTSVRKGVKVKTRKTKETRMYHTTVFGRRKYDNSIYLDDNDYFFFEIKGPVYLQQRNMQMAVKSCQLDITENSNIPGKYHRSDVLIKNG